MGAKVLNLQVKEGKILGTFEIPSQEIFAAALTGKYTVTDIKAGPQGWVVHVAIPLSSIGLVEKLPARLTAAATTPFEESPEAIIRKHLKRMLQMARLSNTSV